MYILIGIVVAFFALGTALAVPSSGRSRNERPCGRRVPGDANASQSIVAAKAVLALDGIYMPIPR